ncbi:MAG: putative lipopolysaccharide heptosyltransferase III [Nitrospirota bacterium]
MNSARSSADEETDAVRADGARVRSLLIFKLRYLGDVVLTTPAIRLLRRACPTARLTAVVFRGTEDALRHNPHLDAIVTVDRGLIERAGLVARVRHELDVLRQLRAARADASIDFDSGERGAYMARLAGAPTRIGFRYARGVRPWLFTVQVPVAPALHTVERNLRLVEQAFGVARTDDHLELVPGAEADRTAEQWLREHVSDQRFVIVHPGARFSFKQWQSEKWGALIDRLQRESGVVVVLAGGPDDGAAIEAITARAARSPATFTGKTLLEFAALCRRAAAFLGNDSGPAHVAAAAGTRVVALFGPTDPAVWGPWGDGHQAVSHRAPEASGTAACVEGCACQGLHAIAVETVYAAAVRALAVAEPRVAR